MARAKYGRLHLVGVQTIGEKLPALVPILRPVPDLVICKKAPSRPFAFPTEMQFKFEIGPNYICEQTKLRKTIKTLIEPKAHHKPSSNASKLIKVFNCT